jgi:prepilin-type N-terminal cleavage/methylation domain-containing protein
MPSILRRSGSLARNTSDGFTLVELAVVLAIVALLLGALLAPLATQQQLRKNKEAERALRDIKEALIGFAISNGRLPWPDTGFLPDGMEDIPGTPPAAAPPMCSVCEGRLPWQDLGVLPTDPWGRLYVYRIAPEFGYAVQTGQPAGANRFDLFDVGDSGGAGAILINTRAANKNSIVLTTDAAAAVVSLGSNGKGGRSLDGASISQAPTGTDERINSDGVSTPTPAGTPHFFARQITLQGDPATCDDAPPVGTEFCEFDDLVVWIPRVVLINRMVEAGRLP